MAGAIRQRLIGVGSQPTSQRSAQGCRGMVGTAGRRCGAAQQPARHAGRVVVEGLEGDQDQVGDTIGAVGADDELRVTSAS